MGENDGYMVVGLDGSSGSARALRWAQAHVEVFGTIQPVASWQYPWWAMTPTAPGSPLPPSDSEFHDDAERKLTQMVERVPPADLREPLVVHGPAGQTLVDLGRDAALIVVGSRGRGVVAAGVLGSVGLHCVNHATVPVAVVPADAEVGSRFATVVVGVDGSDHAVDALAFVLRHATADTDIEVVYAWNPEASTVAGVASVAREELAAQAEGLATETVEKARTAAGGTDVVVRVVAPTGDPRTMLREAAADADLLVVGARGRQRVAYLLLGSVASALTNNPPTTTIVVR
ncbi:MAG: universal stress protein [Acidimicrobiia bacterium]|nr:universal stress protein [Acidimicrobiia bacterium]